MGTVRRALALTAASVMVSAGCSSGGDELLVAAGDTPEAVVAAAVEATRAGTGRFQGSYRSDLPTADDSDAPGHSADDADEVSADDSWAGEFAHGDHSASMSLGFSIDEDESIPDEHWMVVDGRRFQSLASVREMAAVPSSEFMPVPPGLAELPEGAEWVELGDEPPADTWAAPWLLFAALPPVIEMTSPFGVLDHLSDVRDAGAGEVDGTATHGYTATIPSEAYLEISGYDAMAEAVEAMEQSVEEAEQSADGAEGIDAEDVATVFSQLDPAAVRPFLEEYLRVEVDIDLLDGRLRRTEVRADLVFPDEYAECKVAERGWFQVGGSLTIDYTDLGAEIDLVAPDPASVITHEQFGEIVGTHEDLVESWDPSELEDLDGPSFDSEAVLQTADGPRVRYQIEADLLAFGSVVGFVDEDPYEMDDAALVEAHDRASAAIRALPRTATSLGELTRPELLWNLGNWLYDAEDLDSLTDAELGARIDGALEGELADGSDPEMDPAFLRLMTERWGDDVEPTDEQWEAAMPDPDMDPGGDDVTGLDDLDPLAGCPPLG